MNFFAFRVNNVSARQELHDVFKNSVLFIACCLVSPLLSCSIGVMAVRWFTHFIFVYFDELNSFLFYENVNFVNSICTSKLRVAAEAVQLI